MTITIAKIEDTEYGKKAVLDAPYDVKDYIKVLPWGDGKFSDAGIPQTDNVDGAAATAAERFDFPDEYAAHPNWNGDSWEIDKDAVQTAIAFWKSAGHNVEAETDVQDVL